MTWLHCARGEFGAALTCIREAQLADPLAPIVNSHVGLALAYVGRVNQAVEQILKTIELDPDFALAHYHLGTVYSVGGRFDWRMEQSGGYVSPLELAYVHAGIGDVDSASRLLEQAVEDRSADLVRFRLHPWPGGLRNDPRFEVFAGRIGLPAASARG